MSLPMSTSKSKHVRRPRRHRHVWRWLAVLAAGALVIGGTWFLRPEPTVAVSAELADVGSPVVLAARAAPPAPQPVTTPESALPAPAPDAVALTFDDGPHPEFTIPILDILDRYGVKATFFVLGENVEQHPEILAEILRRGHSIAPHSIHHDELTKMDDARLHAELLGASEIVKRVTNQQPTCHRPPYGSHDARTDAAASGLGLSTIMWQVDTNDWRKPGAGRIATTAGGAAGGQIVLMHDGGGDRSQTVAALPGIIESIRSRGLRIVPICANVRAAPVSGPARF
ncbi:MAG: polysaccharide deacetylase family protein [Actinobacteria bacterium ATB1]|nr:polysaccharide deacetylase family protein [Actinobacteria bacterium ATB1]